MCYGNLITRTRVYQELSIELWMKEIGYDTTDLYLYPGKHKMAYNTEWLQVLCDIVDG